MRSRPAVLLAGLIAACTPAAERRGATVLFASGADLQSINPLFTVHPLARQVQRYVLLTTLVRRDSSLAIAPYLARRWSWSGDGRRLTLTLFGGLRWHDGSPTTARDAAWTLSQARVPATGYPRHADLAGISRVQAPDDSTLVLEFAVPPGDIPDVLTDLAILPTHLLDTIPPNRLRRADWHEHPVGNGPFRFVQHEPNRRWVFARNAEFPRELGGPPLLERLVIAVVDEPMTKLAALTAGELDFAGIQPAHASFVARDPALAVRDYPLLFSTGIVFNARRAPFAVLEVRRRVTESLDRQALVDGFAYGFGTVADGPVPPELGSSAARRLGGSAVGLFDGLPLGRSDGRDGRTSSRTAEPPSRRTGQPPSRRAAEPPSLAFELLTVGSGEAALEQMIQAQLAARGITVVIRQLELSAYLERVYGEAHDFEAAVLGTPGDFGLGYLGPLAALSGMPVPTGGGVEALLRFFRDSLPVAFLYHSRGLQGVHRRVQGVDLGLRGELASVTRWSVP
jgi:peptide/nickel transport system substrate-binding protein